jgi:hypothetical protein
MLLLPHDRLRDGGIDRGYRRLPSDPRAAAELEGEDLLGGARGHGLGGQRGIGASDGGLELAWSPDPVRRLALSEEALAIARSLEDPASLAHVLLARDYTIHAPDNLTERFAATTELLAIVEQLHDPVLTSRALSLRFKAAMTSLLP